MTETPSPAAQDVVDFLLKDHERIRLHLLEASPQSEPQSDLERVAMEAELLEQIRNLKDEIEVHLYVEEQVLYPHCTPFDAFKTLITRCHEEHRTARSELQEAFRAGATVDRTRKALQSLRADLERHFQFEESELFPQVRQLLPRTEREELGRKLELVRLDWRRTLKRAA